MNDGRDFLLRFDRAICAFHVEEAHAIYQRNPALAHEHLHCHDRYSACIRAEMRVLLAARRMGGPLM
jgi:hypothetical protein